MNCISLAIPFYNTSEYFLECIRYSVDDDFITEIVVNDDVSTEEQWLKINDIIKSLNTNKIKLYRNKKNLGSFRNKYDTVSKCSNSWVYLLDSDNAPFENTYSLIKNSLSNDPLVVYCPQHLYCKNDNVDNYEVISDYSFDYDLIGINESKSMIANQTILFGWFFNSGNYIINRDNYLQSLHEPYSNLDTLLLDADTAASFYFLLKHGTRFKVIDGLSHHHRLRKNSTWNVCGERSQMSVNYYKNLVLSL